MNRTQFNSWVDLQKHLQKSDKAVAFALKDPAAYIKKTCGLTLDFSKQRINTEILNGLIHLAKECQLKTSIEGMMQGAKVNISENKAALHTALRLENTQPLFLEGANIMTEILSTREKMYWVAERLRAKKWLGYTGLPVSAVVNIGIGGSDLGPRFCIRALSAYCSKELKLYFISDADPESFNQVFNCINPETTLFIISSKSFTTKETLFNASKAMTLYPNAASLEPHFIAVTAYPERAQHLNIKSVLPIWEWVGGRYSLCSAINLITAIAIGSEAFSELLRGAQQMDAHLLEAPFEENLPVLMALIGIWNNNFLQIHNLLILAYSRSLEYLVPYIQQLDMESNGKSIDLKGEVVPYATGPIVWGGLGNQAQHSYFQLLCQGTHQCAAEFITLDSNQNQMINDMCHYKMKVLSEGLGSQDHRNHYIPGNMPLTHLSLIDCSPKTLGSLVALYEHKIFVQSVIWNINPFDQPGVERAKLSTVD